MNLFHEINGGKVESGVDLGERELLQKETYERLSSSILEAQETKETADAHYYNKEYDEAFTAYDSIKHPEQDVSIALSEYMASTNEGLPIAFHPIIDGRTAEEPVIGNLEEIGRFDLDASGFTGTVWYKDVNLNSRTCVIRLNNPEAFVAEPAQEPNSPESELVSY